MYLEDMEEAIKTQGRMIEGLESRMQLVLSMFQDIQRFSHEAEALSHSINWKLDET